ncbi:MAG: phosphoribosylformylglycinamidine synthase subunit PurS [Deltaproteobacteria bacterium]|nr:phosphoribosylformylglycinamidine synthase subunit PurS [Deltaproteobacteria bacterium]
MKRIGKIFILPKKEVLDPQGKAVTSALHSLGFAEVVDVRVGRFIELALNDGSDERVREMCEKLLANTVVEDYTLEIVFEG